jgi:hypothetical protein
MKRKHQGIFCLEGDWWGDLNRSSTVKPVLKLVCQTNERVSFVHRDVGTVEEFEHYLKKWAQRGRSSYSVLYLAFHGDCGLVCVGDQRFANGEVTLERVGQLLQDRCNGRLIHFGSCSTLKFDERRIHKFLNLTGAVAATGFRADVDWLRSSAFEALLFDIVLDGTLTRGGAQRIKRRVNKELRQLARDLKFRIVIRKAE